MQWLSGACCYFRLISYPRYEATSHTDNWYVSFSALLCNSKSKTIISSRQPRENGKQPSFTPRFFSLAFAWWYANFGNASVERKTKAFFFSSSYSEGGRNALLGFEGVASAAKLAVGGVFERRITLDLRLWGAGDGLIVFVFKRTWHDDRVWFYRRAQRMKPGFI